MGVGACEAITVSDETWEDSILGCVCTGPLLSDFVWDSEELDESKPLPKWRVLIVKPLPISSVLGQSSKDRWGEGS